MWQPDSSVCPSERRRRRRRHLLVSNYGRHQKSKRWTAAAPLLISIKIDCLIWHWPRKLQGFLRFSFGEKSTEKQRSLSLFFFYVKSLNGAAAASRAFGDIFELFFFFLLVVVCLLHAQLPRGHTWPDSLSAPKTSQSFVYTRAKCLINPRNNYLIRNQFAGVAGRNMLPFVGG